MQRLQARGLVRVAGGQLEATREGYQALGPDFVLLPTGDALREYWLARLPAGECRVLEVLVSAHPRAVERDQVSAATGCRRSSRDAYLQRLRARRLVVAEGRAAVRAAEELFG